VGLFAMPIVGVDISHYKKGGRQPQKLLVITKRQRRNLAVLVPNDNQKGTLLLHIQDLGFGETNPKR